jgi:hypothetical protein
MTIVPTLRVLSSELSVKSDQALCRFAEFLGLRPTLVTLPANISSPAAADGFQIEAEGILALSFDALRAIAGQSGFDRLLEDASYVLVYGFPAEIGESPELKKLTGDAFAGVTTLPRGECHFAVQSDFWGSSNSLTGTSFEVASDGQPILVEGPHFGKANMHLSVAGRPYFASVPRGRGAVFLLAETRLVDCDIALTPETNLRLWYAQLIGLSIFFRGAFGAQCWTAPTIGANFIVDDPDLNKRYGCFRYDQLLENLKQTGIALTVAFIPYNFRRSDQRTVERLRAVPDQFSIAVHGCDHTGGEYASSDDAWLEGTTALALDRMSQHCRATGMPNDNVMVFPQGRFSIAAIGALKRCGLDAAVNSSVWPVDWIQSPLCLRDVLDGAVTHYGTFPIFARRYPRDTIDFAFDALFQRPLLGVEHHQYFRKGFSSLEAFTQELEKIVPNLEWKPLGRVLKSSCLIRCDAAGQWKLRHFTSEFVYRNDTKADMVFAVEKPESDGTVDAVLVNGKTVSFELRAGWLRYAAAVPSGMDLTARVVYKPLTLHRLKRNRKYGIRVFLRRFSSDVRDNYLSRCEWLLRFVESLRKAVHRRD